MKRDEIIEKIRSQSPQKRYDVAKYLAGNQIVSLESELKIAHDRETVGYIKKTFCLALTRLQTCKINDDSEEEIVTEDDQTKRQHIAHQKGVDEMASMFLHELEGVVGRIALSTEEEINNYDISESKIHVEALRTVIEAITQIKEVNKSKNTEELNIGKYLNEVVTSEFPAFISCINIIGNAGLNCICDKSLLKLAIVNGIRNGIEASLTFGKKPEVNISWGETDIDWFITIRDNGLGLTKPVEQLMKNKVTTKDNHLGYGLMIITKAMERIDGNWNLSSDPVDGANLTLRWNK